jgi:hypothetical protein
VGKQVVADELGGVGAAVTVLDADEGGGGASLDLAVVLEVLVGLDDGEGVLAGGVAAETLDRGGAARWRRDGRRNPRSRWCGSVEKGRSPKP